MQDVKQGGVTALVPLKTDAATARQRILDFKPFSCDTLHFMTVALVRLSVDEGPHTHLLIEANFDGDLREFASSWARADIAMVNSLLDMSAWQSETKPATEHLYEYLRDHNHGTGTYYAALAGVSRKTIAENSALFDDVAATLQNTPTQQRAQSAIFAQLQDNHPDISVHTRSARVRYGPHGLPLVRKFVLSLLVFATWVASGFWQPDGVDFTSHFRDLLTLLAIVALVVTGSQYLESFDNRRRSGLFKRDGGQPGLLRAGYAIAVLGLTALLCALDAFSAQAALFIAMFLPVAAIWPGFALLHTLRQDPFSHYEKTLQSAVRISAVGITALLVIHFWLAPENAALARASTLLMTLLAVLVTIGAVVFEREFEQQGAAKFAGWICIPVVLAAALTQYSGGFSWPLLALILIPIGLMHWFAYEVTRVRQMERSQQARLPPNAAHLQAIAEIEDRPDKYQNHLLSVTHVEPKRVWALKFVLCTTQIALRWSAHKGNLMGIPTIHFARWVLVPHQGRHYLLFLSNYGGPFDAYLDQFIDNAASQLNLIWGPTIGFPRTHWMFGGGANRREEFKRYARSSQVESLFHYSAYPQTSVDQIEEQLRLRNAIASEVSEAEQNDLLKRFQHKCKLP